jgi:hypothetical protein
MIRSLLALGLLFWSPFALCQNFCGLPQRAGASGATSSNNNYTARLSVGLIAAAASAGRYSLGLGLQSASLGGYACFLSTDTPLSVAALAGSPATLRMVASTNQTMLLEWSASDNSLPVTYSVYADTNPFPVTLVVSGLTDTTYQLANLNWFTLYYWQIVTADSFGRTTPSGVYSFSIAPYQTHMIAAPNPFSPSQGGTTFMFTMAAAGSAHLEIYSLPDVRRVFSAELDGLQAGVNIYAYNGRDSGGRLLGNGVYSVLLNKGSSGGGIERFKIISAH